jgi:hypothetical protein
MSMHTEIDNKHAKKKHFLLESFQTAKAEEEMHVKQNNSSHYLKKFRKYAYPIHDSKFKDEDWEEMNSAASKQF